MQAQKGSLSLDQTILLCPVSRVMESRGFCLPPVALYLIVQPSAREESLGNTRVSVV